MTLIKLRMTNELGKDVGALFVNIDQIVSITEGQNATELDMTSGHIRFVKDTPDEVAALTKTPA